MEEYEKELHNFLSPLDKRSPEEVERFVAAAIGYLHGRTGEPQSLTDALVANLRTRTSAPSA